MIALRRGKAEQLAPKQDCTYQIECFVFIRMTEVWVMERFAGDSRKTLKSVQLIYQLQSIRIVRAKKDCCTLA